MKTVIIASSAHPWDDQRVFLKEAKSLAKKYKLKIYATADFKYKKIGSIDVYGLPQWKKIQDRRINRKLIFRRALKEKDFIFHFHDPELIPIAICLKFLRNAKIVYDSHEDVPRQILTKPYINKKVIKLVSILVEVFEFICSFVLDGVIVTTVEIYRRFPSKNTSIVRNYPILGDIKYHNNWKKKKDEIVYVGLVIKLRGAIEIIKAITHLDVVFNLAGKIYPDEFRNELEGLDGWKRTKYWGFANRDQINQIFSRSKIGMLVLRPDKCYMEILPVKLFEYMIAGIPTIASNFPKLKSIIDKHQCGICVDPNDTLALIDAINFLIANPDECVRMGKNGRRAVEKEYNWSNEERKLLKLYRRLNQ